MSARQPLRMERAAAFVEYDCAAAVAGPVRIDQDLMRRPTPDLVRNPVLPVDFGQDARRVPAGKRARIQEGHPPFAHVVRIVALAEKPEHPARIAVENRVIQPDVPVPDAVSVRMTLDHGPVADDEFLLPAVEIDEPETVGIGIGRVRLLRKRRIGIAVAPARNPVEIQRHAVTAVRRDRIDRQFITADHAGAETEDPGDQLPVVQVVVVVDEAVRAARQKKLHASLLMAPGARRHERLVAVFADHADFSRLAGERQALLLRNPHRKVQRLRQIPRVAVVITEKTTDAVRGNLPPFVIRVNAHAAPSFFFADTYR